MENKTYEQDVQVFLKKYLDQSHVHDGLDNSML